MDGSFFPRENQGRFEEDEPDPGPGKLVLLTVLAAVVVVGALLLLNWAGLQLGDTSEYPMTGVRM